MFTFISALLGAVIYRLRGWGPTDPTVKYWWKKRPILQVTFALPFALVLGAYNWWFVSLVLLLTTLSVSTGHASIIDLGHVKDGAPNMPADGQQDEWYTRWIPGKGYWHDFAGLMVSGILITAPCGLVLALLGQWVIGVAVLLSGVLKAVAYAIGWKMPTNFKYRGGATGEFITGLFLWGSLAAIAIK